MRAAFDNISIDKSSNVPRYLQLHGQLEALILNGKIKPDEPLMSDNEMMREFCLSRSTVRQAVDELVKSKLAVRINGKGTFINSSFSTPAPLKSIYMLGYGMDGDERYFNNIVKMTYPPYLKDNYSFFIRTVSRSAAKTPRMLDIELERIDKTHGIDCVLISACHLDRESAEKCLSLSKPVIFLGDFSHGPYSDLNYNSVTGDNRDLARVYMEYFIERKHKCVTTYSGSLKHSFNRQFHEEAMKVLKDAGVELNLVEFDIGISSLPKEERRKIYSERLANLPDDRHKSGACVIVGVDEYMFSEELARAGIRSPEDVELATSTPDMEPFIEGIYQGIENAIQNKKAQTVRVKVPRNIIVKNTSEVL